MNTRIKTIVIVFNSLEIGGIGTKISDICRYYSQQKNTRICLLLKNKSGTLLENIPPNVMILSPPLSDFLKLKTIYFPFWLALIFSKNLPKIIP